MNNFVNHTQVLIDHAIGRVQHLNRGSCPDLVRGHDSRDSDCPVCIALDAAITSHTGAALNDLCEAECAFANKPAVLAVQPTPPGWKLVPVSPTEEMVRAGVKEREGQAVYKSVSRAGTLVLEGNAAFEYCAMLAAAPEYGIGPPGAPSSKKDAA